MVVDVVVDSVGVAGLVVSTVTLVDAAGGVAGCTTVVDELAGAVGSFTTVVEEVEAGRSHAASPIAITARRGISLFIGCLHGKKGVPTPAETTLRGPDFLSRDAGAPRDSPFGPGTFCPPRVLDLHCPP